MKDISPVKTTLACFVFLMVLFLSGDLVIAVYSLFVTGVIMYFLRGRKELWSSDVLLKIGGVGLFVSLIYPLVGVQLAVIVGFLGVLGLYRKILDGRFAFGTAIFFLVLCPVFLALKQDKVAEGAAIFAYYFLATGVIQEIVSLIVSPKEEDEETEMPEIKPILWKKEKFEKIIVD